MWEALGPDERRYLLQLPLTQRFTLGGKRFLLVHATPRDPLDEYLLKDPETWARRVAERRGRHRLRRPLAHAVQPRWSTAIVVLNPGSVGQPRDGDPRAAYAIIDDNRIELKRVDYPVEETIAGIEALPWAQGQGPDGSRASGPAGFPAPRPIRPAEAEAGSGLNPDEDADGDLVPPQA